jgi:hypothetical protein
VEALAAAKWSGEIDLVLSFAGVGTLADSKPLTDGAEFFNTFVGKSEKVYVNIFPKRPRLGCKLSEPLRFADSSQSSGIQIADVAAAATVFAFTSPRDELTDAWRRNLIKVAHYGGILPDFSELDMTSKIVQRNAILLRELHRRARAGASLVDGMPDYVNWTSQQLGLAPILLPDDLLQVE